MSEPNISTVPSQVIIANNGTNGNGRSKIAINNSQQPTPAAANPSSNSSVGAPTDNVKPKVNSGARKYVRGPINKK